MTGPKIREAIAKAKAIKEAAEDLASDIYVQTVQTLQSKCKHSWIDDGDDYHSAKTFYNCEWCNYTGLVLIKDDLPKVGRRK